MALSRADWSQSAAEGSDDPELIVALTDLQESAEYAREEGFPTPSKSAINSADRLLREIHKITPLHLEVYPTPDGEIAIHIPNGHGRSVVLLCGSDGAALCLANLDSGHRRKNYPTADSLPDKFLHRALAGLGSERS